MTTQIPIRSTRADDERLLAMLELRDQGVSCPEIGRRLGVKPNTVKSRTTAVWHDLKASEET